MTKPSFSILVALAGSTLAVTAVSRPALAQVAQELTATSGFGRRDFRLELGVVGGGHYFHQEHTLGRSDVDPAERSPYHAGAFGVGLGFHLGRYLTLEAEGLASRTRTRDAATDLWIFQLGGHVRLHPHTEGRFQPYLMVGYGAIGSLVDDEDIEPDDQDGIGRAGLGIRIRLSDRIGVRFEGRVQSSLAFASRWLPVGDETAYGGPDFQGLMTVFVNLGEQPARLMREKIFIQDEVPFPDPDRDGLHTRGDKCPREAEDPDGFQDDDGCPDLDNDGDGLADARDRCPLRGETRNQIDDEDGCPETDDDGDGLLGSRDQCPDAGEIKNGFKDGDGCADDLPAPVKSVVGVIQGVKFRGLTPQIVGASLASLDQIVEVLKEFPELKVEIAGHTDGRGREDTNRELSQKRAEAVREYLVSKGIARERVGAVGYGMDRPIATNRTQAGRASNRRVELKIAVN
jgi:outer membrane protein OmpA-like peptidoglycan-associated protein